MKVLSAKYSEDTNGYVSHYHDAHELLYVVAGSVSINIGGKEREAGAGSLLVFSRFEEHSVHVINRTGGFDHIIDLGNEISSIEQLFQEMAREYSIRSPMYEKVLDSMLTRLLVCLYRLRPELFLADENSNTEIVRQLQSRFEQNYWEQFSLSELAGEYHVSPSHLSHVFKKITGYAPIEYLLSCRLSAAKNLLSSTDKSIKEIIDLCGFSDESNFSRSFRGKVGMTPTEFRKIT